jgi:isopentenyl-diphosphate delta-isomerase type 1
MQNPHELFDVVDERDRVVAQAPRAEVHRRHLRHRAVHVFVFNPHGELFLQKRAATKDTFPGCYDSSASGHLDAGESYDASAARELREELGLSVEPVALRPLFKIEACAQTGWEFIWVYQLQTDQPPQPNPAEIASGQFWPRERIEHLVADTPGVCAPSFRLIFCEFCRRALWPAS